TSRQAPAEPVAGRSAAPTTKRPSAAIPAQVGSVMGLAVLGRRAPRHRPGDPSLTRTRATAANWLIGIFWHRGQAVGSPLADPAVWAIEHVNFYVNKVLHAVFDLVIDGCIHRSDRFVPAPEALSARARDPLPRGGPAAGWPRADVDRDGSCARGT